MQLGQLGMSTPQAQRQPNQNWQQPPQGWQQPPQGWQQRQQQQGWQSQERTTYSSPDRYDQEDMLDLRASLKEASSAIVDMKRELSAMKDGGRTRWRDEGYYGNSRGSQESVAMHFDNKNSSTSLLQSYKAELKGLMHEAATWQAGVGNNASTDAAALPAESMAYDPNMYK